MLLTHSSSKTVIKENFKRYWPVPVISLLAHVLFGLVPILMNYYSFFAVSDYAKNLVNGSGFMLNSVITISAVVASASVFGFLHDPVSSNAMHAMPTDRRKLFASSAFSGWVLTVLPLLAMSVILLLMRGAQGESTTTYVATGLSVNTDSAKAIFTLTHSLYFIITTVVTATFLYAICCLAAVLAGLKNIHALLSMFLIMLPLMIVAEITGLCGDLLRGFVSLNIDYSKLSVLYYAITKEGYAPSAFYSVYYLILSAVLFTAAYLIYSKVKLERIGQATTFPIVGDFLCVLITFMIGLGLSEVIVALSSSGPMYSATNKTKFIIVGLVASAIIYALMRMIADSTVSVFHMGTVKKFAVYLVVFAIFMELTAFDLTGYQKRLPERDDIASVTFDSGIVRDPYRYGDMRSELQDEESIQAVYDIHKVIAKGEGYVDERDFSIDEEEGKWELTTSSTVYITWHLKNGRTMSREYSVSFRPKIDSEMDAAFEKLFNCKEFRESMKINPEGILKNLSAIEITRMDEKWNEEKIFQIKKDEWPLFIEAMNKDIEERKYDEQIRINAGYWEDYPSEYDYLRMNIELIYSRDSYYFSVNPSDKNVIAFVKARSEG